MAPRRLALTVVTLLMLSGCGGSNSEEYRDSSGQRPLIAKPGANPTEGGVPLRVRLFDDGSTSDSPIVRWEWNLGGGWNDHTSTQGEVWQTYGRPGMAVAQLRITDAQGRRALGMLRIWVDPALNAPPVAAASADPTSGYAPLAVSFSPAGSYDPDGHIVKWEWDFGAGFADYTASQGDATHTFQSPAVHTATLRVTDDDGAVSTATVTVTAEGRPNVSPTAQASATPTTGVAPLTVSFSAAGSSDPDGALVGWEWDFGAGYVDFTATQGEASHTFTGAGSFTATLRVTDDLGASATASVAVMVDEPPAGWAHTYGMSQLDEAYSTVVDTSGNVYVAGRHAFNPGTGEQRMLLLAKYSTNGDLLWVKTYGGSGSTSFVDTTVNGLALDTVSNSVVVLSSSNELSVGGRDFVLTKFAASGTTLWGRSWGGSGHETASGLSVDSSGNIYATGTSAGFGGANEVALVKFNSAGDLLWQRLWGTAVAENGLDVSADATGAFVLADSAATGAGRTDPVLLRFSTDGSLLWKRGYSGNVSARSMAVGGGAIQVGGNTHAGGGALPRNLMAARFDTSGNLQWIRAWGHGDMLGRDVLAVGDAIYISGTATTGGSTRAVVAKFGLDGSFGAAALWNPTSAGSLGFGMAFGDGLLHLAGAAPNNAGSYSTASGSEVTVAVTPFTPAGFVRTPAGASTWVFGLEDPPGGVADTGGGGNDMLVLKNFQL